MFLGSVNKSVHNHGYTAALFLVKQIHSISERIHYGHEILTELWIVVIHIASVEICDLILECSLLVCSILLEPSFEFLS